ncbi:MAG: protein-glutamate O-methyltransferase CheR [Bacteroidota bacterium]|nr:protein-glutamate O-methyltransferase CheR [Bacteroidota bacterium]MDP3145500.1 protein-glutamate O-methyltransferase CheR [Bacteroidota bacterium]MDP3556460.1 protein-glutamate O-methyltransferase CheR [Bacteroidota bacterium]
MNNEAINIINDNEVELLTDHIFKRYGYDFSDYSQASFKRRINRVMQNFKIPSFAELDHKVIENEQFFNVFIEEVTVNVTEMFRDPAFYKVLRKEVIPQLSTYPLIRIWHAGCSTGEEVYSMAILLKEAGLLERTLLYATDINQQVLEKAASMSFPLDNMKEYTENYINCGGLFDFSDYYVAQYGKAVFLEEFRNRMVFSPHNLVLDQSFNEFNLILCRNVLIYFNRDLQNKVIKLFSDSLPVLGYLALGNKESISFSSVADNFETINKQERIWRKKK